MKKKLNLTFELAFGFFVFDEGRLRRSWGGAGSGGGLGNDIIQGSSKRGRMKEVFVNGSDGLGDEFFNRKLRVRLGVRVGWF